MRRGLSEAWREPGTRMGVWTHFVNQFSGNVFALLWGYPFLVEGEKSVLTLIIVATTALTWTVVLAWPGRAPAALLRRAVVRRIGARRPDES